MAGPLKNLWDRLIPLTNRSLNCAMVTAAIREGKARYGQSVLVSSCGFWEMDNFDPLLAHMKAKCRNANREFAGALLRPHGPALKPMASKGAPSTTYSRLQGRLATS